MIYKTKLKINLKKEIKIVKSDHGGQNMKVIEFCLFANYLREDWIFAQYTMQGTLDQMAWLKGEIEILWIWLGMQWENVTCQNLFTMKPWNSCSILNNFPSNSVSKTHHELWTCRKWSLIHFHVWGCLAEVKSIINKEN